MLKNFLIAGGVLLVNFILRPLLNQVALMERGTLDVFGGEDLLYIAGFVIAALIIKSGCKQCDESKRRGDSHSTTAASHTESEQK